MTTSKAIEVVAALIRNENRFLICQRPAHKARGLLWEFVGGKVESGESLSQALVRECREELDVTVRVDCPYMEATHEYPDLTVHLTLLSATIIDGTPMLLEHNAFAWVTPSELDQYAFCPADTAFVEQLKREYL